MTLSRLHAIAVDCAHELINGETGIKGGGGGGGGMAKSSNINKRGVLNKVEEGGKKRNN